MNMVKVIVIALGICLLGNGCMSTIVYKQSKRQVALKKAEALGDAVAIKAVRLGNDGVGIGIDITSLEVLSERPWYQLGAAIVDAALMYGAYEGYRYVTEDNNDRDNNETSGGGTSITVNNSTDTDINIVNGDNNVGNNDRETEMAD